MNTNSTVPCMADTQLSNAPTFNTLASKNDFMKIALVLGFSHYPTGIHSLAHFLFGPKLICLCR